MKRAAWALLWLVALPGLAQAVEREVLANGMRVLVTTRENTEVMTAELLLPISVADEPEDKLGVRYLTQRMLLRGTTSKSGEAMGEELSAVGGVVDVNVGLDYVEIYVQAPSDGFEVALGLLAEAVRHPAFLAEELDKERQAAVTALRATAEDPFQKTYQAFREEAYRGGPYGRWSQGRVGTLGALTREDVVRFYRERYGAANAVLSIAGGVAPGRAKRAAHKVFDDWSGGAAERERPDPAGPLTQSEAVARELPTSRVHLVLGFPAPAVGETHYYAMQVMDSLLSGGSTARLPRALREEAGLAYQVSSFYPTLVGGSHFAVYAVTEPESAGEVKAAILRELERLRREPVSPEELARAKRYLLGSYALARQQSQTQAYSAAWYEVLGLKPEFEQEYREQVNSVTSQDVQEAARELIQHFVLALTMPSQ